MPMLFSIKKKLKKHLHKTSRSRNGQLHSWGAYRVQLQP